MLCSALVSTCCVLHTTLTSKNHLGLCDDTLDVHRRLFHLCSDKAARSEHEIRVGLTVAVLEVESTEEYRRRPDRHLAHLEPLAQLLYQVGKPYVEAG
jgi:hypothetical protein